MPTARTPLNDLKLVLRIPEIEYDEEDDTPIDPDEYDETPWLKIMDYDIKLSGETVGSLRLWEILVENIRDSFYSEMDEPSDECMQFGWTLFDKNGYLREKFQHEGVAHWGCETDFDRLLYCERIKVHAAHRGKVIAKKALQMIFQIPEVVYSGVEFVFAWPALQGGRRAEALSEREFQAQTDRLVKLFRTVGFRRVGYTSFLCLSKGPRHPSRRVAIADDAPLRIEEDSGAHEDREAAFQVYMDRLRGPA